LRYSMVCSTGHIFFGFILIIIAYLASLSIDVYVLLCRLRLLHETIQ
jgi:hypothetical protein